MWTAPKPLSAAGRPASRQPAGLLWPLCGLSEACLFSSPTGPARKRSCRPQLGPESFFYGLPKATLETHGPRPQTPLGSWQACLSLLMVFRERRWACGRPPNPSRQLAGLPLLLACPRPASSLLMVRSESNVRHCGPPPNPSRQLAGLPLSSYGLSRTTLGIVDRPQTSWQACLSAAGRPVVASLWPVRSLPPLFLWASEGDVRHFGPPSKPFRQPAGLLRALCGLSEACLLSSYGLPKATLGILDRLQKPLGSRQASCGLSVACPKPAASSLLLGFRRRR